MGKVMREAGFAHTDAVYSAGDFKYASRVLHWWTALVHSCIPMWFLFMACACVVWCFNLLTGVADCYRHQVIENTRTASYKIRVDTKNVAGRVEAINR